MLATCNLTYLSWTPYKRFKRPCTFPLALHFTVKANSSAPISVQSVAERSPMNFRCHKESIMSPFTSGQESPVDHDGVQEEVRIQPEQVELTRAARMRMLCAPSEQLEVRQY